MPGDSNIVNWQLITRQFYIAAGSEVFLQVGTSVFLPDLPAKAKFDGSTTKGIAMSAVGGGIVGERKVDMPFQAKCFGGTNSYDDAFDVAKAFANQTRTAHGTDVAAGRVIGAQIETFGQMIREPGTETPWKYVLIFGRIQVGPLTP